MVHWGRFYSLNKMFLDIKLGIAWSFFVAIFFNRVITPEWLVAGTIFALLPDLDFLLEYLVRGTVGGTIIHFHRTLFHSPLTYLPITLFVGVLWGDAWMTLFGLCIVSHFLHDSVGMGFGIRWLWPFSTRWQKFFSTKNGEIHYAFKYFFCSWSDREMHALVADRGNDHWLVEDIQYHWQHRWMVLFKLALAAVIAFILVIILPL